jgi:succinate dehydrogenase / fumarate reductase membrane anchor subunit
MGGCVKTVRPTASAGSGFVEWLLQRISAVYLAGFCLYLTMRLLVLPFPDHYSWTSWFTQGGVRLAWALALTSLLIHAWVGMRSVYLDYVKPLWVRFVVQTLTALAIASLALWAADILLGGGLW